MAEHIKDAQVHSDAKEIIELVKQKSDPPWHLKLPIQDILNLSLKANVICFHYFPREENFLADTLANHGRRSQNISIWGAEAPNFVSC